MKPKRHPKPARSDPSIDDVTEGEVSLSGTYPTPPELEKLRELNAKPQGLIYEGGEVVDDYIETAYYVRLQVIDKQHHTTGTGFIKMDKPNGSDLNLKPISTNVSQASCKWNPATNDWVPEADQSHASPTQVTAKQSLAPRAQMDGCTQLVICYVII
ncbi:hypothetical protein HPP92_012623 [Vanilla planifolia]|uniref:Uncharacterized protein n=1 Tax=Vanilla planifolia TaxID=51239 RepID=A0A835V2W9_VANPL|nr:hypothetical protein HPP92_012623 [Vanilla planifolia]